MFLCVFLKLSFERAQSAFFNGLAGERNMPISISSVLYAQFKGNFEKFLSSSFKLLKYQEGNGGVKFVREQLCPAVKWSALC